MLLVLLLSFFIYRGYNHEKRANAAINAEKQVSETLLLNILPAGVAQELGMAEPAVRKAIERLRLRWATVLREEVAGTLTDPAEVDSELRWMVETLRSDK